MVALSSYLTTQRVRKTKFLFSQIMTICYGLIDKSAIEELYRDLDNLGFQYWSVSLGTTGVSFD